MVKYIPAEECKDNFLYIIDARNANIGIYNKKEKSFTISRIKFKDNFLFDEYHWDTGEPFGTAKPLKEIEETPVFIEPEEKLEYLNKKIEELKASVAQLIER